MANLTRYNPFNEVVSLREAMDRLFEDSFISRSDWGTRHIAANLYETPDGFILQVPMPGTNRRMLKSLLTTTVALLCENGERSTPQKLNQTLS